MMEDPKLAEAVRIVREIVRPLAWARERWSGHGWVRDTRPADALDAVLAALERLFKEWDAVVAALGPHAHPGLSPSESVAEVVNLVRVQDEANREMTRLLAEAEAERDTLREKLEEKGRVFSENLLMQGEEITRLRADNLSLRLRDQTEQEQEIARLLAEREALRVELGEMALVLEQQTRTLTREHEQRERAEAALIAIRAGSIRLAAAGIVGHLHVVEQCSAALRDPAPAEEDPGLLKLAAQCAPAEEPKP